MVNVAGWIITGVGGFILLKGLNDLNNREFAVGVIEAGIGIFIAGWGALTLVTGGV
jgi:hypothetical protein